METEFQLRQAGLDKWVEFITQPNELITQLYNFEAEITTTKSKIFYLFFSWKQLQEIN